MVGIEATSTEMTKSVVLVIRRREVFFDEAKIAGSPVLSNHPIKFGSKSLSG